MVANARSFQRVLRVAPNPDVAQTLLGLGIKSATQIATLGQQQFFLKATAAGLTKPEANQAFQAAAQRYANVVSHYMQFNRDSIGIWPQAMGQVSIINEPAQQAIQRDQSLATLFGSQDYCATDDCTSILSPAAYLCDLLLWLRNHPQGAKTALDVLDSRRPDIRHLLLNCPNTDTELPYIDLVNELLGDKISPPPSASTTLASAITGSQSTLSVASDAGFPSPNFYVAIGSEILLVTAVGGAGNTTWTVSRGQQGTTAAAASSGAAVTLTSIFNPQWKQTSADLTAAQLSAAPEYFNQAAYVTLFGASYPFSLPYSTGLDELRTYLQQWNLPLWQLRQALLPLSGATVAQKAAVAAERFGIPPHGEDLVANPNFVSAPVAWNTTNPATDVAPVPAFLQAASLTYESLLELLEVAWVQGGLNIAIQGVSDTCDTSVQSLVPAPLDLGFLDRAHRFLRLWLATGYKMWELDLLLGAPAVANGTLDPNALAALLSFRQLQDATHLAVDQQLAFYQNMDTATHRDPDGTTTTSLYQQVFLNPTVTWAAPDPDMVNLPTGAALGDPILGDHLKAIQPALGVSGADAATLFALTDNQLTLANLSLIYRVNALAAASKFSISNLLSVAGLLSPTAANPAAALAPLLASPAATLAFLAEATTIQQSGLTLDALTYLLTPPSAAISGGWATTTQMTPANIAATLGAVQQALLNLLAASTTLASPITAAQTSITVASDVGFPAPNFYIYIGSEILLVTAVSGAKNTTWTVVRGQQGTTAASAASGAAVTPTAGDLNGAVIAAVAANAHSSANSPLANDVTALILQNLQVPGVGQSLLSVLMDPSLLAATGTITIGGSPTAGDTLQAVLTDGIGGAFTVSYTLTSADNGSVNQTASDFAQAINASPAVVGPQAFLAPCTVSGAVITLTPLAPGAAGSSITSTNTATPGGAGHVSVSPGATETLGQPAFQNQFLAIQLFDKVAVLVRGLHLVAADFSWLLANPAVYGGLDLTQLPVTAGQPALSLSPLLTTLLLIKLARLWTAAPPSSSVQSLYDLISGVHAGTLGNAAAAQAALATITGWPLADIEAFAPPLGLAFPASYTQPATYDALRTLEAMTSAVTASGAGLATPSTTLVSAITASDTSITVASDVGFPPPAFYVYIGSEILLVTAVSGVDNTVWTVSRGQQGTTAAAAAIGAAVTQTSAAQIVSWATVPQDEISAENLAASALGALKAQQPNDAAWLALAPTLMNPIRDRRSAALQGYLIAQRDGADNLIYGDTDGLFDYFLIDVQMTSCQVTSRVVQAYIAVQIFVERCLMNLEAPEVVVDLTQDDTWNQWQWMSRYRIWEANREVFLYPENWLIESQRPNRSEIYQTFEQEVRQGQSTADYLETVVLNYIDRLDGLAHLLVTGTCQDPASGDIYVVARSLADPPVFYLRSYVNSAWTGWAQIQLDIKAHQVVPALYRGRVCLFWLDLKVSNEPKQQLSGPQISNIPPSQEVERYVTLGVNFSIFRNGSWAPAQASKGKLFDKPLLTSNSVSDTKTVEALYTLKVQTPAPTPGYGANLWVDVFRFGGYNADDVALAEGFEAVALAGAGSTSDANAIAAQYSAVIAGLTSPKAVHVGRAVFDGRFNDLELNSELQIAVYGNVDNLYAYAQSTYGPDAQPLLPLAAPDPDLNSDSGLEPEAGALAAFPSAGQNSILQLNFTSAGALEQNVGPLLNAAPVPLRVVGPDTDLNFDPTSYFFFQDNRRCYYVESQKYYWTGSFWSPVAPSDPSTAPYKVQYDFHPFYHPFTRLFWNQLAGGGFDLLYDVNLQQTPDNVDPSYSDVFSFQSGYQPVTSRVWWDHADAGTTLASPISASQTTITVTNNIWVPSPAFYVYIGSEILKVTAVSGTNNTTWTVVRGQQGTSKASAPSGAAVTPTTASQDRQFLDFSYSAPFSVYNWELFYHIPLYIAQLLSQNQQFEDAQTWFQYIFNPTRQGSDPVPQRFWIPQPLHNLTSAQILAQQINNLLLAVNQGDPTAVAQVETWRNNSFNPFVLADLRNGVPYMKSTVMSYLDNLIAWGDNLFSTESREALSEATLIYVIASEILGPTPVAVTPPQHADESFDQLEPSLDAFANAMVEIENVIGGAGGSGGGAGGGGGGGIPGPQTFYFKIPSNAQLLGYWTTVADRLYKLRHCQNIAGAPLQLALFDAPIDPGLLIAAQAAGVDFSSVLSDLSAPLPSYRFTSLYPQALDFVNAVRAYGAALQAALEKSDAGQLALLQQTLQQQLLIDGNQILAWQVQQAQSNIDALNQSLALAAQKFQFNSTQEFVSPGEAIAMALGVVVGALNAASALQTGLSAVLALVPDFHAGATGAGGTPHVKATFGGKELSAAAKFGAGVLKAEADVADIAAKLAATLASYARRQDNWTEAAAEAQIQIAEANDRLAAANFALQIAQQNQTLHQEQIDNIQKQIDFLNDKFTSVSLYDWMAGSLSATYFQSYRLAYQMCKQVERCYQFELGIFDSSFILFGYWDSLYKGLLAGETLSHDLRRMQASYLQQNVRRYELSRFVSLGITNPAALQNLLVNGACDFTLPESLFDNDYPGHYNRRLTRVSLTVVYPSPGKFDNVKATLTLLSNQVRVSTDTSSGYVEGSSGAVGSDTRFIYNYAANAQKIAMGNAQDDPGLFENQIHYQITDVRYLPFENAGAISSWHLEMSQINNEVDLSTVGDVVIHLYYTALDGGATFQQTVQAYNAANLPTSGVKIFSAQNDFSAQPPTATNPYPPTPWQAFLSPPVSGADQLLSLSISPLKFPPWTRGKNITVNSLTVLVVAWPPPTTGESFTLWPQSPLPTTQLTMTPVAGVTEPYVCSATIPMAGAPLATWGFKLQPPGTSTGFTSLSKNAIGDVLLLVNYDAS